MEKHRWATDNYPHVDSFFSSLSHKCGEEIDVHKPQWWKVTTTFTPIEVHAFNEYLHLCIFYSDEKYCAFFVNFFFFFLDLLFFVTCFYLIKKMKKRAAVMKTLNGTHTLYQVS